MGTYARNPVEFVRGEGTRLWDDEGNEYLDFLAGISVVQLGHCHPRVVDAVCEQARRLIHVGNLYYTEPAMRLLGRLADARWGAGLPLQLRHRGDRVRDQAGPPPPARRASSRSWRAAFTAARWARCPQPRRRASRRPSPPGAGLPGVAGRIAAPCGVDERTAAVLIEPIQGEGGIHPLEPELLAAAREACDEQGALLIFDEIQCGMGRSGTLWAWQQAGVEPDVMTVAKGLGGGLPIGACVTSPDLRRGLQPGDHGSTFGGGPVVAAGANAVLDVVDDARLPRVGGGKGRAPGRRPARSGAQVRGQA